MDGIALIAEERRRQIEAEGYDPGHDDRHDDGELAIAASVYAMPSKYRVYGRIRSVASAPAPIGWPFEAEAWKPSNRIRELEKAGALIAAELDRLLRLARQEAYAIEESDEEGYWGGEDF